MSRHSISLIGNLPIGKRMVFEAAITQLLMDSTKPGADSAMDRRQGGFTLIECLVAIMIFLILITGLSSLTVMVVNGNSASKSMTAATALAADKMEDLQNMGYDDIASGGPETLQTIYSRQWTVANNSPVSNTKTIVVTVSWSWLGMNRNVALRTIITK